MTGVVKSGSLQGVRGHWTRNYVGTQSFITIISYTLGH